MMFRKFDSASTGAASLHWCQHVYWFDPAFQLVGVSHSVDRDLSSFFVSQSATICDEHGASIVSLGTALAHTHDGSIDSTRLEGDPDFASITFACP